MWRRAPQGRSLRAVPHADLFRRVSRGAFPSDPLVSLLVWGSVADECVRADANT